MSYGLIVTVIAGLVVGSFVTAIQNRLDNLGSVLYGRSRCPKCNHILGVFDLLPIFSFVFLRGRCRYCRTKISFLYPIIELLSVVLALFTYYFSGFYASSIFLFLSLNILLLASVYDVKDQEVDTWIFVLGIVLAVVWRFSIYFSSDTILSILLGGVAAAVLPFCLSAFSKEKWMGYGDSFFATWIGVLCGFPTSLAGIFFAFLLGSIFGIITVFVSKNRKKLKLRIPFGPFIAASGLLAMVFGNSFIEWYLKILGF